MVKYKKGDVLIKMFERFMKQPLTVRCGDTLEIFPRYGAQEWDAVDGQMKEAFLDCADRILELDIPQLPATAYMEFQRTGEQQLYDNLYYSRRSYMLILAISECLERKGRYMDRLIDYIWMVCEETSWAVPEHNNHDNRTGESYVLPNQRAGITVDLYNAMTAAVLSCIYYIMKEALDDVSTILCARIEDEVRTRVIEPVLHRDDFGWMGFLPSATGRVNNWNPWILSNVMVSALFTLHDRFYAENVLKRCLVMLDHYINIHGEDGGCDEGPGYWNAAGGTLFDALDMAFRATDGVVDVYSEPLIYKLADYIRKVHLCGPYFANFGDNAPKMSFGDNNIYRMAEATGNQELRSFALFMMKHTRKSWPAKDGLLPWEGMNTFFPVRIFYNIFDYTKDRNKQETEYAYPRDAWLGNIEVMTAHEREDGKGFVLAAKGAHNDESHNHNDVGQFMVYYDGKPILIDMSVGAYTKKTFSPQRYEIFTMQSAYHNLPTINGVMQKNGRKYAARVLDYQCNMSKTRLLISLKDAYPPEAGIEFWEREFILNRKESYVMVTDTFAFADEPGDICWNLISCCQPNLADGRIGECRIRYDGCPVTASAEEIRGDDVFTKKWGGPVYRTCLQMDGKTQKGRFSLKVESAE